MNNELIICDAGPIFSLATINELELLEVMFKQVYIPNAVWEELTLDKTAPSYKKISAFFSNRVKKISGLNELTFVMDYGEAEAVVLYQELNADYLLIDDRKARAIAENFGADCIGTIGILILAKQEGRITRLRPFFEKFLENKRYYSVSLLNMVLEDADEEKL